VRILYLTDIRFPLERANGIQSMETCYALAERGHEVTLLVRPDTQKPPRDPFSFYGLPSEGRLHVRRVAAPGHPTLRRMIYLASALTRVRRIRDDIVFTRDLGVAAHIIRFGGRRRPPLVFESHGLAPVVGGSLGSLLSTAQSAAQRKQRRLWARERMVWMRADGYVAITAILAGELASHFGPREYTRVIADGVRLDPGRQFTPPRPSGASTLGYAGHLYPWKGVDTLLHALSRLPHANGLVVGGHPQEPDLERLRRLADALCVGSRVTFTGLVPPHAVGDLLSQASILVLPNRSTAISARYSSPLKLFEYMASGRPIVASDLPAFREVLRDGENALLVPPEDPDAMAAAVRRLETETGLAERLARAAFDQTATFTWEARAERLEALFHDVLRMQPGALKG